jgi:hypothetical protein
MSPVVGFLYCITSCGIQLLSEDEKDVISNPENYWEMKIIGRGYEIAPGISVQSQHQASLTKHSETFQYPSVHKPAQFPVASFDDV